MIQEFLDAVTSRVGGFWTGLWAPMFDGWPLWWSWGVFVLILAACLVVGFFLQFKWVRAALGLVVGLAGAWLLGRHTMYNAMKAKLDAERARKVPKPRPTEPTTRPWIKMPWDPS